jgi:acyl carrier protein
MIDIVDKARKIALETLPTTKQIEDDTPLATLGINEVDERVLFMELEDTLGISLPRGYHPATLRSILDYVSVNYRQP